MDFFWTIIGSVAATVISAFLLWFFREGLWNLIKKPNSDTLVENTPEEPEEILDDIFVEYDKIGNDGRVEEPLINIAGIGGSVTNLPLALRQKQISIEIIEQVLEYEVENIDETKFAEALTALADNDIFAEIEKNKKLTARRSARIALVRGAIAEQQLRWKDAAKYYRDATRAYPCFETLVFAQRLFVNMGSYDSALTFSAKAKKATSTAYGENSEQYVTIIGNLAETYQLLGKYQKAESIYLQVIDICEKHSMKSDSLIANNNLGVIYLAQQDYTKALSTFNEVLAIKEKMLGKNHPDTTSMMNNIAYIYALQGQYTKAEEFYKRAIKIRHNALGENNRENGTTFNNLAQLYVQQNRYNDAEECYQKAIQILKNTLVPDHPTIKTVEASYEIFKTRHH